METACKDKFSGVWANAGQCLSPARNYECGISQSAHYRGSFAEKVNREGGGMYAMERTSQHVKMWFWPRGKEPAEIAATAGKVGGSFPDCMQ